MVEGRKRNMSERLNPMVYRDMYNDFLRYGDTNMLPFEQAFANMQVIEQVEVQLQSALFPGDPVFDDYMTFAYAAGAVQYLQNNGFPSSFPYQANVLQTVLPCLGWFSPVVDPRCPGSRTSAPTTPTTSTPVTTTRPIGSTTAPTTAAPTTLPTTAVPTTLPTTLPTTAVPPMVSNVPTTVPSTLIPVSQPSQPSQPSSTFRKTIFVVIVVVCALLLFVGGEVIRPSSPASSPGSSPASVSSQVSQTSLHPSTISIIQFALFAVVVSVSALLLF